MQAVHGWGCSRPRMVAQPGGQTSGCRGRLVTAAAKGNYYEVLGVDVDATDDEIKSAYRRKAKELHPDLNKEDHAEAQFKACKVAYETLIDENKRREYDQRHCTRRLNFFQDVDEDDLAGWPRRTDPWEVHRRMWETEQQKPGSSGRDGDSSDPQTSPEELLERLAHVMGGQFSPMRQWGSGRLDPFGSSSSEAWHRRVHEQTSNPGFGYRGRPVYGTDDDDGDRWDRSSGPAEWNPYRPGDDSFNKRQGWQNPSRPEWQQPRRRWEEGDEGLGGSRGGGGRGPGSGGIPGDGGFRGKPL